MEERKKQSDSPERPNHKPIDPGTESGGNSILLKIKINNRLLAVRSSCARKSDIIGKENRFRDDNKGSKT